jgi:lysylphosphatidylglycerol synthetase-like protein (DUF2156 family)
MATAHVNTTSPAIGSRITPERNGFQMGLLTALVLCVYTLIAALLGFFSHIEAGSLDVLILVVGATLAIRRFRGLKGEKMSYLGGFGTGIITTIVASIILGLFFVALTAIMPNSLDLTQVQNLFGTNYSAFIALLAIVLMGSMTGMITSLVAMQYYKVQVSDPLHMMDEV